MISKNELIKPIEGLKHNNIKIEKKVDRKKSSYLLFAEKTQGVSYE